jgi:hypothetical protein
MRGKEKECLHFENTSTFWGNSKRKANALKRRAAAVRLINGEYDRVCVKRAVGRGEV